MKPTAWRALLLTLCLTLAHGIGTALDTLSLKGGGPRDTALDELRDAIRALPDAIAERLR